jgi:Glycolipid transfer protein (GLTP)
MHLCLEVLLPSHTQTLLSLNVLEYSGLDFTAQALRRNLDQPSQELSESFRDAYGSTLKPHHSFMVKPIFSAAMSATPYRKDFYAKLGDDSGKSSTALTLWVQALENQVRILKEFQKQKEAKW